jgi:hypothetical protein
VNWYRHAAPNDKSTKNRTADPVRHSLPFARTTYTKKEQWHLKPRAFNASARRRLVSFEREERQNGGKEGRRNAAGAEESICGEMEDFVGFEGDEIYRSGDDGEMLLE